jgi:Fe-S-cluster containining protein
LKEQVLHEQFTRKWLENYQASGKVIYCRDGCAGCCHLTVHATYPEAVAVANTLTGQQSKNLAEYIARLKVLLPQLTDLRSYLKIHRQSLGPCPFLDERGACSIYPIRPLSCRALLSTRPAAWCTVDFSELSHWDKQAYENSLDLQVVAWPTHYVAATQSFGRELEDRLLETMCKGQGWSLSGNFPVMVWLEQKCRPNRQEIVTEDQVREFLVTNELNNSLLLNLTTGNQKTT